MILWTPIELLPPELQDGREVLLWLRAPYDRPALRRWSRRWGAWLKPDCNEEEVGCCTSRLLPSHYAAVTAPSTVERQMDA